MDQSASTAQLRLRVGSLPLAILNLEGTEALSNSFRFKIEALVDERFYFSEFLGSNALLSITGPDGCTHHRAGLLTHLEERGLHNDGRRRTEMVLESNLALLRNQIDSRIILGQTTEEIVRGTLERHGIGPSQVHFHLSRHLSVRPTTLQAQESDYQFIRRLLAGEGIFFWSSTKESGEALHFCDHNSFCPPMERGVVPFIPSSAMEPSLTSSLSAPAFHHLETCETLVANHFRANTVSEQFPSAPFVAASRLKKSSVHTLQAKQARFSAQAKDLSETERQATLSAERAQVESQHLLAHGNLCDLFAGTIFSLDASRLSTEASGDYLATKVRHRASQLSGQGTFGEDHSYTVEATLIRRETPFRPPLCPPPETPLTFSARIESEGPYAKLDDQGRYRLRAHLDRAPTPHAEGSIPIRRLTPYGGPAGESPAGWHTPLRDNAEVLVSCLNGDPDTPMIVGSLPNPETQSPVTSTNPNQNILRSAANNELCMDDACDQEVIRLQTFEDHNILELNAAALGHKIRLATQQGSMQLKAKKTLHVKSGDTLTERSGADRIQTVENSHRTATNNAEIHHQAATDIRLQAAKNIALNAEANIEATSAKRLSIDVAQGASVTVRGQDAIYTVRDGNIHFQAAKDVRIIGQGGGDITFGQAGGGFVIKADGTVQLFGNKVTLKGASGVSLNGSVNYQVGGAEPMAAPETADPLVAREISLLTDQTEKTEPKREDICILVSDEFNSQLPDHVKLLDGTPYQLISDKGEIRRGTIQNGEINEAQVLFDESFKLAFGKQDEMEGTA